MSWVHVLHNETASESVRNSLEELTCSLSGGSLPGGHTLDALEAPSVSNRVGGGGGRGKATHTLDYEDEEEEMDDEAFYRPPAPPPAASMEPPTKHLLEIAPELLPCPSEHTAPPLEAIDLTFTASDAIIHIPGWLCVTTSIIIAMW